MLAATVVAVGIRLFTLSRPGFLTSPAAEYDDGVYLGAAIRLTQGVLPYKDFAFVQPPGILLLMSPVALFARMTSTAAGLALARILTALASAACVPLAGRLVRYRGTLITALTCFILAIYPSDIATAHTLLLEPWMNLLCLLGANAAFSSGRLTVKPGRLAWAGVAIGFAAVVKLWAMAPALVLLIICLMAKDDIRVRRTVSYVAGLAAGFVIPIAPFVLTGPSTFYRSTILYQAGRVGTYTPLGLRLAHITGVIDILDYWSRITVSAGGNSLFGQATVADTAPATPQLVAYLAAAVLVAVIGGGYLAGRRAMAQVEWFALATAILAVAAILWYSAFFYHYPAFPAPWLALAGGVAIAQLATALRAQWRPILLGLVAVVMTAATILQLVEVSQLSLPTDGAFSSRIQPGACVVADQVSMLIAADRFDAARPGCPDVIDALATTLVMTNGVSVQGGADKSDPQAIAQWQHILSQAQYVWLSPNYLKRVLWPPNAQGSPTWWEWFDHNYKQIYPAKAWVRELGQLFERRSSIR
jgi:alpha-1,2-mannosyltransferase